MPYTYTELDLGVSQDVSQGVSQDVSQGVLQVCCKLVKHPLFFMYPQIVYIVRKRTF